MAKKPRKKPQTSKTAKWIIIFLAFGAAIIAWWFWSCTYNVSPRFNYLLITKNGESLRLLNREVLHLHPRDKLRILEVFTNVCLNRGIRLVAADLDVNALLLEELTLSTLLPGDDILNRFSLRILAKHYNEDLGYVDLEVEPLEEDWLVKAERTIDGERKITLLIRALKAEPDSLRIKERLIKEYKSQQKWNQLALMLEGSLKDRFDDKALRDLLEVYEAMSHRAGVISVLERLLDEEPKDPELRLRLAEIFEEEKRFKRAIKEYKELIKVVDQADRLPIYKTLGFLYTETNQIKKAIEAYHLALKLDKKDVNLYYNLSLLYEKSGDRNKADDYLMKAVGFKSEDVESRLKLAERFLKKGKRKEAEKYLSEILTKNPESLEALLLMIQIAEKRGNKMQLKGLYGKVLPLDPNNQTIIYNLGVLEYETGNLSKSRSYFEKLAKRTPNDPEIHDFLFDIYKKLKKSKLAFSEAKILMRLKPKDLAPYYYVLQYLDGQGKYKEIAGIAKKSLKTHPKNINIRKYLILAYLKTGKENQAISQMEKVLEINPKDAVQLLQLAKLQERRNMVSKAAKTYHRFLKLSPRNQEGKQGYLRMLLKLAKQREREERFQEALNAYKEVLDLSPDNEEAEKAYLRLRFEVLPGER